MDSLFNKLCELALDPFARDRARADGSELSLRQELARLDGAEGAIANGSYAACYACSEPGADLPPDGFGKLPDA